MELDKKLTLPFWILDNLDDIIDKEEIKQNLKLNKFQKKGFKNLIYEIYREKNNNYTNEDYLSDDDIGLNIETKNKKTYLIKDKNNGYYKIGFSNNPKKREKTLQSENPNLQTVKVWNKNIEKELHLKYKEQRIRGEYFNLSNIQVKYICTHY